jgi:hypothetical protein
MSSLVDGETVLGRWITEPDFLGLTYIPEGTWRVHVEGYKTSGTKDVQFGYKIYKVDVNNNSTLIGESDYSKGLNGFREGFDIYTFFNEIDLNSNDRIRVDGIAYVSGGGSAPSVRFYLQGDSHARLEIPIGAVSVNNFVPYLGATTNVDLGSNDLFTMGDIGIGTSTPTDKLHVFSDLVDSTPINLTRNEWSNSTPMTIGSRTINGLNNILTNTANENVSIGSGGSSSYNGINNNISLGGTYSLGGTAYNNVSATGINNIISDRVKWDSIKNGTFTLTGIKNYVNLNNSENLGTGFFNRDRKSVV